jgi:hypothetical protein
MTEKSKQPAGITRRNALGCLGAWSGAALIWGVAGGVPRALGLAGEAGTSQAAKGRFTFAQISDTHVGFHKEANPDVIATLRRAIADINGLSQRPAFAVHTGDITHLSKPEEFALADEVLRELSVDRIHYVPGEHDALDEGLGDYVAERRVPVVVYRHAQHLIDVYWFGGAMPAPTIPSADQRGYHAMSGSRAHQRAWIVSDLDPVELTRFAGLLQSTPPAAR